MQNVERIIIPLSIGAAVLGIWAALRKPSDSSVVQTAIPAGNGSIQIPQVAPLEETLIDPSGTGGSNAGTGMWTSRPRINARYQDPLSQLPGAPRPTTLNGTGVQGSPASMPSFANGWLPTGYVSQLPPWSNGELQALVSAAGFTPNGKQTTGGCGCGGSCGGCGGASSGGTCPSSNNCDGMMDGAGAAFLPLYASPKASKPAFMNSTFYSVETQVPSPSSVSPRSYGHMNH